MRLILVTVAFLAGAGTAIVLTNMEATDPYVRVPAPRECAYGGYYYQDQQGRLYSCETLRLATFP